MKKILVILALFLLIGGCDKKPTAVNSDDSFKKTKEKINVITKKHDYKDVELMGALMTYECETDYESRIGLEIVDSDEAYFLFYSEMMFEDVHELSGEISAELISELVYASTNLTISAEEIAEFFQADKIYDIGDGTGESYFASHKQKGEVASGDKYEFYLEIDKMGYGYFEIYSGNDLKAEAFAKQAEAIEAVFKKHNLNDIGVQYAEMVGVTLSEEADLKILLYSGYYDAFKKTKFDKDVTIYIDSTLVSAKERNKYIDVDLVHDLIAILSSNPISKEDLLAFLRDDGTNYGDDFTEEETLLSKSIYDEENEEWWISYELHQDFSETFSYNNIPGGDYEE